VFYRRPQISKLSFELIVSFVNNPDKFTVNCVVLATLFRYLKVIRNILIQDSVNFSNGVFRKIGQLTTKSICTFSLRVYDKFSYSFEKLGPINKKVINY